MFLLRFLGRSDPGCRRGGEEGGGRSSHMFRISQHLTTLALRVSASSWEPLTGLENMAGGRVEVLGVEVTGLSGWGSPGGIVPGYMSGLLSGWEGTIQGL